MRARDGIIGQPTVSEHGPRVPDEFWLGSRPIRGAQRIGGLVVFESERVTELGQKRGREVLPAKAVAWHREHSVQGSWCDHLSCSPHYRKARRLNRLPSR